MYAGASDDQQPGLSARLAILAPQLMDATREFVMTARHDDAENDLNAEELDAEINAIGETFGDMIGWVWEIASELENRLAEYDFMQVKESVEQFASFVENLDGAQLRRRAKLTVLLHKSGPPSEVAEIGPVPYLNKDELPIFRPPASNTDSYDARMDFLDDRVSRCSKHIRRLLTYFEESWEVITDAAQEGDAETAADLLDDIRALGEEARSAYNLWEASLATKYNESPGSLGYAGEMIDATLEWLADSNTHVNE